MGFIRYLPQLSKLYIQMAEMTGLREKLGYPVLADNSIKLGIITG